MACDGLFWRPARRSFLAALHCAGCLRFKFRRDLLLARLHDAKRDRAHAAVGSTHRATRFPLYPVPRGVVGSQLTSALRRDLSLNAAFARARPLPTIFALLRCIAWSRLATVCLAVCYSLTLALELEHPQPIVAPSFGIARAVVGIVVCYIAFFVSSHQAMRWAVLVSQLPLIASDVFYAPVLRILVDCRANGSCLASTGFNITELRRYEALQHVSAFFSVRCLGGAATQPKELLLCAFLCA